MSATVRGARGIEQAPVPRLVPMVPLMLTVVLAAAALWLEAIDDRSASAADPVTVAIMLIYAVAAAVIGTREPGNRVWWLMGLLAILMCAAFATERYTIVATVDLPDLPGGAIGAAASWLWPVALGCPVLLSFVVPTGEAITPAWRLAFRIEVAAFIVIGFVFATGTPGGEFADTGLNVANPIYLPFMAPAYVFVQGAFLIYLALFLTGVAALAVRFRRSRGVERQQLKWILFGFAAMLAGIAASNLATGWLSNVLFTVAFALLPGSLAVAIGRYRLYDIDLVIRRTLSYAIVTGLLGGTFALLVVALQGVLAPVTGSNALAVAGSTLVVASLFQPLRRRIQQAVDRRFDRAHYDAEAIVTGFVAKARVGVGLTGIAEEVASAASRAVAPATATVWLRHGHRGQARRPTHGGPVSGVLMRDGAEDSPMFVTMSERSQARMRP